MLLLLGALVGDSDYYVILCAPVAADFTEHAFDTFLSRQRAMYTGGDLDAVGELLTDDVVWHVPGTSAIAGDHRGRKAVLAYFQRRRALAGGRMGIVERARLTRDDTFVQLADGETVLDGHVVRWRTAGVYRLAGDRVAEAWLVPLELDAFDAVWRRLSARG